MNIITIDFETYYSQDYSLSKMTTEAYIRDPRFEVILVGVLVDGEKPQFMNGPQFANWATSIDWKHTAVLCHHAHFDAAILTWKFNITPALWLDTLSMARAVIGGYSAYFSLGKLAEFYELPLKKGTAVVTYKNWRYKDFAGTDYRAYGKYCMTDCKITRELFDRLSKMETGKFPTSELRLIDRVIRMYTEPKCYLDTFMLHDYHAGLVQGKEKVLIDVYKTLKKSNAIDDSVIGNLPELVASELSSANKFASILIKYNVEPPTKISITTGKETFAFAKSDEDFIALLEHENPEVQQVVAARLKTKSTIAETRALTMLGMSRRGEVPIYYKYSGADQTHRFSGGDKTNFQNLPRGGVLRNTICAPPGHKFVVVDSANIEARVVDTLAGQENAIKVYRDNDAGIGPDIYCYMASIYYGRRITKADKMERQFGKTIKLACGFGMGPDKFVDTARTMGKITISLTDGQSAVRIYRGSHGQVKKLWYRADACIEAMQRGNTRNVDSGGIVTTTKNGFVLPNGLVIKYPYLARADYDEWVYTSGRMTGKLYGGKAVENIVQALARIIVMEQCETVSKMYPDASWVMSSHDEGAWVIPENRAEQMLKDAIEVFRIPPTWWTAIPLNAEGGISSRYGWAKV